MNSLRSFVKFGLLAGVLLTALRCAHADEQPPYDVKDPAISDNFRNIYLQSDKLSLVSTLFNYTLNSSSNVFCIDSPTLCVDAFAHAAAFGGPVTFSTVAYITNTLVMVTGATVVSSFTANGVSILGTNTNDSPLTGYVGEVVVSNVTTNASAGTTAQWADATSISLTSGDWIISGLWNLGQNGATITGIDLGISITSGNSGTGLNNGYNEMTPLIPTASSNSTGAIPAWHFQTNTSTTVYLKHKWNYTVATPRLEGCSIVARRIR